MTVLSRFVLREQNHRQRILSQNTVQKIAIGFLVVNIYFSHSISKTNALFS